MAKKWAGFPPASEAAIAATERRLKLRLPESYRQFLLVSNGWWLDGTDGPTGGRFASPGSVLCNPISGRVVNLDIARLAKERGRYAIASVRPLLASVGIELGIVEEQIAADSYGVTVEDINHHYFRLRKGHPSLQGGEHEINAGRYVLYETCKLLNKVLKQRQKAERIATLEELQTSFTARCASRWFCLMMNCLTYSCGRRLFTTIADQLVQMCSDELHFRSKCRKVQIPSQRPTKHPVHRKGLRYHRGDRI